VRLACSRSITMPPRAALPPLLPGASGAPAARHVRSVSACAGRCALRAVLPSCAGASSGKHCRVRGAPGLNKGAMEVQATLGPPTADFSSPLGGVRAGHLARMPYVLLQAPTHASPLPGPRPAAAWPGRFSAVHHHRGHDKGAWSALAVVGHRSRCAGVVRPLHRVGQWGGCPSEPSRGCCAFGIHRACTQ
jgi:hypothetical protein